VKEIEIESSFSVFSYIINVTKKDSVSDGCESILRDHGGIDILFNNSPGPKPMDAIDASTDIFDGALQANFLSFVHLTRTVIPGMRDKKFGRVINLTSTAGLEPDVGMVLSNTTRAAVLAYGKTLSREVAKSGITVNTILTGGVMTDRAIALINADLEINGKEFDDYVAELGANIPVGYIASPEEFVQLIVFLASPLSCYVNGTSIPIDGGYMRAL
jgi:3-oxoacyl-[acyl-carrier protein] reductase